VFDSDAVGEGRVRFVIWARRVWGIMDSDSLGAGPRGSFVGGVVYILGIEDGASGALPHLGQAGIIMAGEPLASGADDEGKDAKGDEEGADDRPDHSPSDPAGGKSGSWDKHGPSERPHS